MRMTNIFKLLTLCILGITVACSVSPEMDREMAQRAKDTLDLKQKAAMPTEPIPDDVVRVKNDIWLGDTSKVEFEGEPIPSYLEKKDGITLISNRPITLYEIGSMISKITCRFVMLRNLKKQLFLKPTAINLLWMKSERSGPIRLK